MCECSDCKYNNNNYCILLDDILGWEKCIFKKEEKKIKYPKWK